MDKKRTVWIQKRHRIVRNIACALLRPYCRWKYGISPEPFLEQGDRAYLILANHQTPFDQFFIGISFQGPVYYMATEDIFSKGWISSLIRWLVAPIPSRSRPTISTLLNPVLKSPGKAVLSLSSQKATEPIAARQST